MNRLVPLAVATLALAFCQTAFAGDTNSKSKIYGTLAYVSPLAETDQNISGVTDAVKASSEFGFNLGLEFRTTILLGIELDYLYARHDLEHDTAGLLGETTFQPISGTLNLHVPLGNLDLYAGPTVAYVNWGDLKLPSGGGTVEIDAEFGYGISAGIDLEVLPSLAVTGGLRWLRLEAQPEGSSDALDVNPLFARVGVAAKF